MFFFTNIDNQFGGNIRKIKLMKFFEFDKSCYF